MSKSVDILLKDRFLFFGRNSGIHGLNHIFRKRAFFLARMFWLTIMVVSFGCLYLLLVPVIELDGGINFTPNTLYLNWTTNFPAVTVCESMYAADAAMRLNKHYPDLVKPLSYDQRRYLVDMLFGRGKCSKTRCFPCGTLLACDVPWRKIMEDVHRSCEELITDCFYIDEQFSCCSIFHLVDSEYGPCYSFNTLQNAKFIKKPLYAANRTTGPGVLTFRLLNDARVSIHSPEELSTNNLDLEYNLLVRTYQRAEILFSVVEMENDPLVEDEDIEDRGCRLPHEVPDELLHTYPVYSYGACKLARSTEHSYEHCGCISPLRDLSYQKNYCNYTGLNCLAQHEAQMKLGLEKTRDDEECKPSCVESELSIIRDHRTTLETPEEHGGNLVIIRMSSLPTLRYQRNLLRTDLDLVVSVGGMAGLFFSASVLSVLEIFYLALRKPS